MKLETQIAALTAASAEIQRQLREIIESAGGDLGAYKPEPAPLKTELDYLPGTVADFVTNTFAAQWCSQRGFETSFLVGGRPVISVVSFCEPLAPLFSSPSGAWSSLRSAILDSNRTSFRDSLGVETVGNYLHTDSGPVFIDKQNLGVETAFAFADSLDKLLDRALSSRARVHRAFGLLAATWATEQQLLAEPCSESVFLEIRSELSLDRWAGRFGELAERASVEPSVVFDISNNIRPNKSVARRLGTAFGWRRERTVSPSVSDRLAVSQSLGLLLEGPSDPSNKH